jgi:hypothetical protein
MSHLPVPYESAQQDDIGAALSAAMTVTAAAITSWVIGSQAYPVIEQGVRLLLDDAPEQDRQAYQESLEQVTAVPTIGWTIATVFLVIGALLLLFRRGRGSVIIGALVSVGTTAYAQFGVGYGPADADATQYPVDQWPLFWGGLVVVVLAVLPATGRWIGRRRRPSASSSVIGTTDTGAILWPGT